MDRWTPEQKATIVTEYLNSTETQRAFSETTGISERTLRSWIARFSKPEDSIEQARAIVQQAVDHLQALLGVIEAAGLCRPAPDDDGDDPEPPPASPPAAASCRSAPQSVLAIATSDLEQMVRDVQKEIQVLAAPRKRPGSFFAHLDLDP